MTVSPFVSILGTTYSIVEKGYKDEEAFSRRHIGGFCDSYSKQIVVCDMHTYDGWEHEEEQSILACEKRTLRHEIVHAFFSESGLDDNSMVFDEPWSRCEEMVDWIAIQGPKIYKAWGEAGAL